MKSEKTHGGFIDFSEYKDAGVPGIKPRSHVVKGMHVVRRGIEELHSADAHPDQPEIVVHREGETLVSVEFLCKCGRSTTLRFEYDEE